MRSTLIVGDVQIEGDTEVAATAAMTYFVVLQKVADERGRARVVAVHLDDTGELQVTRQSIGPDRISVRISGDRPLSIKPDTDLAHMLEEGLRESGTLLVLDTGANLNTAELLKELY
ncbi:hypothetical protein [Brachybacterium paraconglomeratum]|uniref:hypothetical protein n=1 Tax=Brachybacterium paraconglomeratum TaxID=173362 RepID=UPI0022AF2E71|nr:hypothetical protein [Brachybacterium paraconglomeratum]MCZ4325714.1 hypothetical protein [Brachybacterium paraconglomeratum]